MLALPVTTRRLTIRRLVPEDALAVQRVLGDPEVFTYLGGTDHKQLIGTPESASRWIEEQAANEERKGYCMYVVEDRTAAEVVGLAGFMTYDFGPDIHLGIEIARQWWQSGYGTEAGEACLSLGCQVPQVQTIYALLWPDNQGALKLVQKLGMRRLGRKPASSGWPEYEVYAHDCPPWGEEEYEERRLARLFRTPPGRSIRTHLLP